MRRLTLTVTPEQAGRTVKSLLRRELHMADGAIARVKTVPDGICRNGVHAVPADAVRHGLDAGDRAVGHMQLTPEQAFDRAARLLRRDGERQPAHSCAASAAAYAA